MYSIKKSSAIFAKNSFALLTILLSLLLGALSSEAAQNQLSVTVKHPIMPALQRAHNSIAFQLQAPSTAEGYRALIRSESGLGRVALHDKGLFMEQLETTVHPDQEHLILFRWSGPAPTQAPHRETVIVSIPELNLVEKRELSIGIDLHIEAIELGAPSSGASSPVHVYLKDRFHPEANLQEILQTWDIRPELRLVLLQDGKPQDATPEKNAFVTRFLDSTAKQPLWPSLSPEPGTVKREKSGWMWVASEENKIPQLSSLGGNIQIEAFLWPQTGAAGIRGARSTSLALGGDSLSFAKFPPLFSGPLEALASLQHAELPSLADSVEQALAEKNEEKAASLLGKALREHFSSTPRHALGRFGEALIATASDKKEAIRFLRAFASGYGTEGLLVFTHEGLSTQKAGAQPNQLNFSAAPKALRLASEPKAARMFKGPLFSVIPFSEGERFYLRIKSNAKAIVSLWKILPQGINHKEYPAKNWEKEITVYGDRLVPPTAKS